MKAPNFWHNDGFIPRILEPTAQIFNLFSILRYALGSHSKIGVPTICIGNIVSGGAGKTPVALSIAKKLHKDYNVNFLTRGYGGKLLGPIQVDPIRHKIDEVGDEALVLANVATTWVAKDKKLGALSAKNMGAEIIIMDDGFQNPSVYKTLSLLVIDGPYGFGNGRLIPSGPLREKIPSGLKRADAIVLIGEAKQSVKEALPADIPVLQASTVPDNTNLEHSNNKVIGFAGIGRPEKFLNTLKSMDLNIVNFVSFPDHYVFKEIEILRLQEKAAQHDAVLVTTLKDMKRLPRKVAHLCRTVEISIIWEDESQIQQLLDSTIQK